MREYQFFVYIMASKSRVLYTGFTNDLRVRVCQHKTDRFEGFTKRYRVHRLVYFESYRYVRNAIAREKEIKRWVRSRRVALIESINPTWEDLAAQWFTDDELTADPLRPISVKFDPSVMQGFTKVVPAISASSGWIRICSNRYPACDGDASSDSEHLGSKANKQIPRSAV